MKKVFTQLLPVLKSTLLIVLVLLCFTTISAFGQSKGPDRDKYKGKYKLKKKAPVLPPVPLSGARLANAKFNFKATKLKGLVEKPAKEKSVSADAMVAAAPVNNAVAAALNNPTSLQFGPDGRLYVSQQNGIIKVLTIVKNASGEYAVTGQEVITLINGIPNHNDNGSLAPGVTTRQVTSLLVTGTADAPILYVSSSDSRIGGPSGDLNLDTNSGIISKLTKTDTGWDKVDLVRGLPRSEENHSNNGMQLDGGKLYVVMGGNTNAGGPSTNFAYTPEYALTTAVLSIDLAAIEALPTTGTDNNKYKYDLPTLDDPTRPGDPDAGDPFGGNDGLNQAKIVAGGPVQVFASGFRNGYDLVITKTPGKEKRMYVTDNGANQGWGGHPASEGVGTATNNYVPGEPGSTGPGPNDPTVNNLDNFHYIGDLNTYVPGSFYGGHPNPVRANPAGAGLYTHNGSGGVWRTSITGANPLPADWPPVPLDMAHPAEGDYQNPGETDNALLTFLSSTNGIAEYTASNFNNGLQGHLLVASFDGNIHKITLSVDGTDVTNARGNKKLNQDIPFASNFGSEPLDITAQGDNDIFPGTVWVVCYLGNSVYVFEPQESSDCGAAYSTTIDDDGDGFSSADEIDNGSNPCSAASKPKDSDGDLVSDFNDADDDNDAINDDQDYFALDASNGTTTTLPIEYEMFNNFPGTGLFGLGFTGLMLPKQAGINYNDLFQEQNLIAGGAVGAFSVVSATQGDPYQALNNQENGFQFGVNVNSSTGPFTVHTRLLGPFFNNNTPQYWQSFGMYIGTGDQHDYLKIVLGADGKAGGVEILYEKAGIASSSVYSLPGGLPTGTMDLYLSVNPATGTVQPKYAKDGAQVINLGPAIPVSGALLSTIRGTSALAVGLISTSLGATPFTATWDLIRVTADPPASITNTAPVLAAIGNKTMTLGQTLNFTAQAADGDVPAQTLTYSVSGTAKATINATTGAFSWKPTAEGTFSFIIKVTDSGAPVLSDEETVTVTVGPSTGNQPPTANAGPDQTIALPANSVVLVGSGSDPNGSIAGYGWAQISGPSAATFSNATSASVTVSNLIAGTYTFSLTVTDALGLASPADQVTVTVNGSSGGTSTVRINSGGSAFLAANGRPFAADAYFSGGSPHAVGTATAIANTTDDELYQAERWGNFAYNVPVLNGTYAVTLHFAEIYWGIPGGGIGGAGARKFHVDAEGVRRLTDYDIFVRAGGALIATQETFSVTVGDGTLNLAFVSGGADSPKVSAIEVVPGPAPTNAPPVVASAISDQNATAGILFSFAFAAGTFTDANGDALTYSATLEDGSALPGWLDFNGATRTFSGTPSGSSPASLPVKVTASDGKGGTVSDSFNINIATAAAAAWQTIQPNGGAPTARHEAAYVQAGDKFYLMGGRGIKPVQVYEPVGRTWTNAAPPPVELHHFQAVTVEGLIYVVGAFTGGYPSETPVPNVYIYNPASNQWLTGPSIPQSRRRGSAGVVVHDNKIYLVGGIVNGHNGGYVDWFDEFDPATNAWKVLSNAPRTRDHFHAAVVDNKLYAAGGRRSSASTGQVFTLTVPEVDAYNFATGQWTTLANSVPTQRAGTTAAALNGTLVVIGGESGAQTAAHKETEALDVTTGGWQSLALLQQGRHGTQAIVNNNAIYIVAGSGSQGGSPELASQEVYYPSGPTAPTGTVLSPGQAVLTPALNFGQAGVSTTVSQNVTLTNTGGNQAIVVSSVALSGSSEFTYVSPVAVPFILAVGQSIALAVHFNPSSNGSKSATLTVTHSGTGGSASTALSGEGVGGTNQAPVLAPIGNKAVTLGQALAFTANATDSENHTLSYSLAGTVPAGAAIQAATGAFSWTPTQTGTYVFTAKVTDNGDPAASDEEQITVTVSASAGPQVTSLTLINADTDLDIGTLSSGSTVNFAAIGTTNLNVRANTSPATVGSVVFQLNGVNVRTEGAAPYALAGDNAGNYLPWTPTLGNNTLTATPYPAGGGSGTAGVALSVTFTVVQSGGARHMAAGETQSQALTVACHPNPFNRAFTLTVTGKGKDKLPVAIYNLYGKVVLQMEDVRSEQTVVLGEQYAPGAYVLQIGTGNNARRLKLIKIQ